MFRYNNSIKRTNNVSNSNKRTVKQYSYSILFLKYMWLYFYYTATHETQQEEEFFFPQKMRYYQYYLKLKLAYQSLFHKKNLNIL